MNTLSAVCGGGVRLIDVLRGLRDCNYNDDTAVRIESVYIRLLVHTGSEAWY